MPVILVQLDALAEGDIAPAGKDQLIAALEQTAYGQVQVAGLLPAAQRAAVGVPEGYRRRAAAQTDAGGFLRQRQSAQGAAVLK